MTIAENRWQNIYPAPDNIPLSSFPQPIPAPETDPDAGDQVTVQYGRDWQAVLLAAVDQLRNPATWQGDHDAVILALNRATNLKEMLQIELVGGDVEAPYWDEESADDAAAAAPRDDQPWYGKLEGEDWVEYISWWIVGAFVATLVTPTGAIAFITPIRHLRLEFKKQNWGGIVKILLDGDTYAEVDTYSPVDGVATVDVYSPGSELLITWDGSKNEAATPNSDGNYGITVIRKRLFEGEVVPTNIRYDSTSDQVQQTYDGGATWVNQPGQDPRHSPVFQFPPIVADDPKCQAAANMTRGISDFLHNISGIASAATNAESMLTIIIGATAVFFPEGAAIGVLAFLALDLASTIFSATFGAVDAAFTSTVYDKLTCIFFCRVNADGTVSAAELANILTDINTQIGGLVYTVLSGWFFLIGEVGLSNMGAKGSAPADCSACDCAWRRCWLSGDGLGDWVTPTTLLGNSAGSYNGGLDAIDGTVINEQNNVWANGLLTEALHVTELTVIFSYVNEGGDGSDISSMNLIIDGTRHYTTYEGGTGSTPYTWTGSQDVASVGFVVTGQVSVRVTGIFMSGTGTPPTTGIEC